MLRRRLLPCLLALLMLLTLQGGAVHALSHLQEALGGAQSADLGAKEKHGGALHEACALCLSFAAMGAALPSAPRAEPPALEAVDTIAATPHALLPAAASSPYLSRAPPRFLA